jgi:hypothetical protein
MQIKPNSYEWDNPSVIQMNIILSSSCETRERVNFQ